MVGGAPAGWGRFDPPGLLLLARPALPGFACGGLQPGAAVCLPPVVLAVESAVGECADARLVRQRPDVCGGGPQVALEVDEFGGDRGESVVGVVDVCRPI